jgi:DNA-binding transcriptional LysR family regulator
MFETLFIQAGLSLERLRTFVEVVEAKGFTAAAKGDPTRQSQFSRQLRELEEFFGAELVNRRRGRFGLTPAGKALHAQVCSHFAALEELHSICRQQPVEISLGAGESLLQWLVLPRLTRIRDKLPRLVWTLQNLRTEDVIARLSDGRTDLGIIRRDAVPRSLRSVALGTMEFALFAPKGLLNIAGSTQAAAMLGQLPLAVLEGHSSLNVAVEELAHSVGTVLNIQLRCSSLSQVAAAVEKLGLAAVLPLVAKSALAPTIIETRTLLPLENFRRDLVLAWNPRQAAIRPTIQRASKELASALALD